MLHEAGYVAAFMDDIEEGDEVAFSIFAKDDEPAVKMVRVSNLKTSPQIDHDEAGRSFRVGATIRFIGTYSNGMTEAFAYGSTWDCYIKKSERKDQLG